MSGEEEKERKREAQGSVLPPLALEGGVEAVASMAAEIGKEPPCQSLSAHMARSLIESVDAFLFDCDGVICKSDNLIEGVMEVLRVLRSMDLGGDGLIWAAQRHPNPCCFAADTQWGSQGLKAYFPAPICRVSVEGLLPNGLQKLFSVDPADYMLAICGDDALRKLSSPRKSGSFRPRITVS